MRESLIYVTPGGGQPFALPRGEYFSQDDEGARIGARYREESR